MKEAADTTIEIGQQFKDLDGEIGTIISIDLDAPFTDSDAGSLEVEFPQENLTITVEIDLLDWDGQFYVMSDRIVWDKKLRK